MNSNTFSDDAWGQAILDCHRGIEDHYIIERNDGYMDASSLEGYFADFKNWSDIERRMPEFVMGRVLDVGCGAGRHALHLQDNGFTVLGIDRSVIALEVAKERGVKRVCAISIDEIAEDPESFSAKYGVFDSIIMMGHNIGLLHGAVEGEKILKAFLRISSPHARVIGTTRDPKLTTSDDHRAYQKWNLENGRMRGQIKFRIRHRKLTGDWIDYLFLSPHELSDLADTSGWQLKDVIRGDGGFGNESYLAILSK